ncbi:MAG: hypothetical protein HY690_15340 [Chloroflexi bacterium]|nr:hypothetical protein [Chloroflexota bacterium]
MRRLLTVLAAAAVLLTGCAAISAAPTPTPIPEPTVTPGPTPDLEATVQVRVAATIAALPTVTLVPTATPEPTATPVPTVRINLPPLVSWSVGVDYMTVLEILEATIIQNRAALSRLRMEGRAFDVSDGDRAVVLEREYSMDLTRIRMVSGSHVGKVGWLPSKYVR